MIPRATRSRPGLRLMAALALAVGLGACTVQYRNHGYAPSDAELAQLVVGVDTRDSVAESVGTPSSVGVLPNSDYYYLSTKMRYFGAAEPKEVERKLVAISFDDSGIVRNIETYALEDGNVVPLTRRVTSSGITDKTFLRQLFGNLGNYRPGGL
ncbi:MAG: cell envelope protein SmpA [Rhodobacteraceae bacterium]|nr:cell envelope protein SmpA [Paracoccaceae bacterium]MAY44626.1 cell envelope protein SmpA [Paracoccaceae bacterium]